MYKRRKNGILNHSPTSLDHIHCMTPQLKQKNQQSFNLHLYLNIYLTDLSNKITLFVSIHVWNLNSITLLKIYVKKLCRVTHFNIPFITVKIFVYVTFFQLLLLSLTIEILFVFFFFDVLFYIITCYFI